MKVLLVASTGGHFQAMQKLRLFWENHNCCWVTFRTPETQEILQDYPVYWAYAPTNRNIPNLWRNFVLASQVLLKERPQLILSTGAGVAVPFIILGKLLGCKTVFVESFTRVEALSLSARLAQPFLDVIYVQWEQLKQRYAKTEMVN